MKKWEYKVEIFLEPALMGNIALSEVLNEFSANGWELVSASLIDTLNLATMLIFRRRIK